MENRSAKIIFISWVHYTGRSNSIAKALGAKDYYVEYMKEKPLTLLPIRYLSQSIETFFVLLHEKPDIIMVMNPPIVLPLIVYFYSCLAKARFIVDSHTGAFMGKWRQFLFLHKYLSRKALSTIVTNQPLKEKILSWGAPAFVLELGIPDFPVSRPIQKSSRSSVCVINSFSEDEPLEEILLAAQNVEDCDFYITGKLPKGKKSESLRNKSENVIFTDFLPHAEYLQLLNRVDAIIVLVKRNFTLLQGGIEAVAVEKPLVTSNWPVLRDYFNRGTVYTDNSPASIEKAVRETITKKIQLTNEMKDLKKRLKRRWEEKLEDLRSLIQNPVV